MKIIASLLMLLCSANVFAGELYTDVGFGSFGTTGNSVSDVKIARVGYQKDLTGPLVERFNGGGWVDWRTGMSDAAFGGYQLGFDVKNSLFEAGVFSGPTLISARDEALGGYFQFNETIFLGIRDSKNDSSIGLAWNHFSSAGLEMPNQGKDFLCLEIKFPL